MAEVVKVVVSGARGPGGPIGPPGTVESSSGFIGPVASPGAGRQPHLVRASDGAVRGTVVTADAYTTDGGTVTAAGGPSFRYGDGPFLNVPGFMDSSRRSIGDSLFQDEFRDGGYYASSTTGGRCSFDSAFTLFDHPSGPSNLNHAVSFQSRIIHKATGKTDRIQGFDFNPTINAGSVGQLYGAYIRNAVKANGATIDQQVGVWVENLTSGASNFSFYGQGGSFYNNGSMQIAGSLTGVSTITASGQIAGQCVNVTGPLAEYKAGGGLALVGVTGAAAYAGLFAYGDAGGAPKGLALNPAGAQVLIGASTPASGGALEVAGGPITPHADNAQDLGKPSFRFGTVYAGTGTINTSDRRAKKNIGAIPDEWLDAWGDVQHRRFKFRGGSRWHIGLIAQDVHAVFAARDIDAFEIGLLCYDQWDDVTVDEMRPIKRTRTVSQPVAEAYETTEARPKVDAEGRIILERVEGEDGEYFKAALEQVAITRHRVVMKDVDEEFDDVEPSGKKIVVTKSGDRWGLRENECMMLEAAYQRRRIARLEAALEALAQR